jgi:hypothetical protein
MLLIMPSLSENRIQYRIGASSPQCARKDLVTKTPDAP